MKRRKAWYERKSEANQLATLYFRAYLSSEAGSPFRVQAKAFLRFSSVKLVFESNCIENVGLPMGETQRIIEENFPTFPVGIDAYVDGFDPATVIGGGMTGILKMLDAVIDASAKGIAIEPAIRFNGKRRGLIDVLCHYGAYGLCLSRAVRWRGESALLRVAEYLEANPGSRDLLDDGQKLALEKFSGVVEPLVTIEFLHQLHRLIAGNGTADHDFEVGQFRKECSHAGFETNYLAPGLIPEAMELWKNELDKSLTGGRRLVTVAAASTHKFLQIHPYGDFNGRMSRLLLAMILHARGIPFPAIIRANSKSKRRYLSSLKRADRSGNVGRYETLILLEVVAGFIEIDRLAILAGAGCVFERIPEDWWLKRGLDRRERIAWARESISTW